MTLGRRTLRAIPVVGWVACGVLGAGLMNADLRTHMPYLCQDEPSERASDQGMALVMGVAFGPIGLVVSLGFTGFGYHGWTLSRAPTHLGGCP